MSHQLTPSEEASAKLLAQALFNPTERRPRFTDPAPTPIVDNVRTFPTPHIPPEGMNDIESTYQGLGWYFCRSGELCKAVYDSRTDRTFGAYSQGYPILIVYPRKLGWVDSHGRYEVSGKQREDLIFFVGHAQPNQKTYTEYYNIYVPQIRELWVQVFEDGQWTSFGSKDEAVMFCEGTRERARLVRMVPAKP